MSTPRRIGIFGGTFDPVHFGHLRPAIELKEQFALDRLLIVPNHRPAHRATPGASSAQRIAMLSLALRDAPGLECDTREAQRAKPSWTVDTLSELRAEHPHDSLVFFMGIDAFAGFDTWHRWADILNLAHLVVVDRPGAILSPFADKLMIEQAQRVGSTIHAASTGVIERVNVTQLAISATMIRDHIRAGRNVRFLLPEAVREYIEQQALYQ